MASFTNVFEHTFLPLYHTQLMLEGVAILVMLTHKVLFKFLKLLSSLLILLFDIFVDTLLLDEYAIFLKR